LGFVSMRNLLNSSCMYCGGVLVAGLATVWALTNASQSQLKNEWRLYQKNLDQNLVSATENVNSKMTSLHENLRTISYLPSVRSLRGVPMPEVSDSRETIQQLYNNLANNLDVSEVYIIPADFAAGRINPETGRLHEPLASFDELIVNAGQPRKIDGGVGIDTPEFEGEEYVLMEEQIKYFAAQFPSIQGQNKLNTPMISNREIITCDDREFATTKNDGDRKGMVFSVPFYNKQNEFAGMVSAVIRTNAIKKLIDTQSFALNSPYGRFKVGASTLSTTSRLHWQPSLFGSQVNERFSTHKAFEAYDPQGKWTMSRSFDVAGFYRSAEFKATQSFFYWSTISAILGTLLTMAGTTGFYRRSKMMRHRATHDALTGLPNRVLMEEQLKKAVADVGRGKQHAVFYLDLDKFKLVNDTLGHHIGDAVLKKAASRLLACIRQSDTLARIGGDEFVLLVNGVQNVETVMSLAARIIEKISQPMTIEGHNIQIGTSIGIQMVEKPDEKPSEILRHADLALFRAKANERGSYRFYEPAMDAAREERSALEADMRLALQNNEFIINYQPIVNAKSSQMSGCEALLRWKHPTRGLVAPNDFIPLAEETGMILAIGEWVLKKACKDAMLLPRDMRIAVNLSPVQFKNTSLALHVVTALNESGLAPGRLELEITESVLLTNDDVVLKTLSQLRDLGVRVALDDFGVGYSSLSYLKSFQFDKIKIDRSFMSDVEQSKESAILKAITDLSSSLGMTTVAEGVETESQLRKVREQGCTEVQGFYFSRPMPIESLVEMERRQLRLA
jgi:diguanylate cyclase (GGDEF)-like protein